MASNKLSQKEAVKRILDACNSKNITFLGFDNEKGEYINCKTHLILKCNTCNNIWNTTPYQKFVNSTTKCPNCAKNKKITQEKALENILKVCSLNDYTFLGFENNKFANIGTKLIVKCNNCGKIWSGTTYINFIKSNRRSHKCGKKNPTFKSSYVNEENTKKTIENLLKNTTMEFMSFGDNGFKGSKQSKIHLKCKKCGIINEFSYRWFISVKGKVKCKSCEFGGKLSNEIAIRNVTEKCNNMNYTFVGFDNNDNKYEGKNTYLIIKCNDCDTIWKTTTYNSFMNNDIKCPGCKNSWKMEKEIETILNEHNIPFIKQCRNKILPWLTNKISLSLDFYLPKHNMAIECQGKQHFQPVNDFGGEKEFKETQKRDKKKLELCKKNNVKLLYYDSEQNNKTFLNEKVHNTKKEIIDKIFNS